MTDHDGIYHQIFSAPTMVAQLLREFAAGPWLEDHDLDRMTRLNAKFHADTGERREGDVIWQIPRRGGGDTYLLLLLEFQSKTDRWMALRTLVYVGLLWQHLIKEKQLLPDGRLPPVVPLVLHRGRPGWAAPLSLRELVGLQEGSPLWQWQPEMRYYIIDEGTFDETALEQRKGLIPLLFRLENAPDPERLLRVADAVMAEFDRDRELAALRSVFGQLLAAAIEPLAPGVLVPNDLREIRNMGLAGMEIWKQKMLQELRTQAETEALAKVRSESLTKVRMEGLMEGRMEGLTEGRMEGRMEGLTEGRMEGRKEGRMEGEVAGRQSGEAAFLTRLLERRFGPLPVWAGERIGKAGIETLEEWGLRVLDAASLEDVLA